MRNDNGPEQPFIGVWDLETGAYVDGKSRKGSGSNSKRPSPSLSSPSPSPSPSKPSITSQSMAIKPIVAEADDAGTVSQFLGEITGFHLDASDNIVFDYGEYTTEWLDGFQEPPNKKARVEDDEEEEDVTTRPLFAFWNDLTSNDNLFSAADDLDLNSDSATLVNDSVVYDEEMAEWVNGFLLPGSPSSGKDTATSTSRSPRLPMSNSHLQTTVEEALKTVHDDYTSIFAQKEKGKSSKPGKMNADANKKTATAILENEVYRTEFLSHVAATGSVEDAFRAIFELQVILDTMKGSAATAPLPPDKVLPDDHPLFSQVPRLWPVRRKTTDSNYVKCFSKHIRSGKETEGIHCIVEQPRPSPSSDLSAQVPPLPNYPYDVFDDHGKRVGIDKRPYYSGMHGLALDLACIFYARRMLGVFGFPEAFQNIKKLFDEECDVIVYCLAWAYQQLNMTSYEDTAFRLAHQNGMALIVFESRITTRNTVKLVARGSLLNERGFSMPRGSKGNKAATAKHQRYCFVESNRLLNNDTFIGDDDNPLARYINAMFRRGMTKLLFGEDKVGTRFPDMFGGSSPIPTMALLSTAMVCSLEEYEEDGSLHAIEFSMENYFREYLAQLKAVTEVVNHKIHGRLYKKTTEAWAKFGLSRSKKHSRKGKLRNVKLNLMPV